MDIYMNNNSGAVGKPTLTKRLIAGAVAIAFAVSAYAGISASAAKPIVQPTNFNTHSGLDYKGVNVGFEVESDEELESVEVSLLSGDETLVTNVGTQVLFDLYTPGTGSYEFSSPFVTYHGTYDTDADSFWQFGDWSSLEAPDRAKIVVNGVTVYNDTLTEPNGWTFDSLKPVLLGENFNTHAGTDYQGINVGFHAEGFGEFESVEVSLYDASDKLLVTNTGTQELFSLYTSGENTFSTPFMTWNGTYGEEIYWELGKWSSFTEPAYAIVTVNGQEVILENLTGPTFESLKFDEALLDMKAACKDGGWSALGFKNQGQCVAKVSSSENSRHNR